MPRQRGLQVTGLALGATHAYWVDGAGGTVSRIPKSRAGDQGSGGAVTAVGK